MGIGWEPIRLVEYTNPERGQLDRAPEERVEDRVAAQGHEAPLQAAERSLSHQWTAEVTREQFVAGLRALADALSQDQNFSFTIDHRFIIMRPVGTPAIEYHERENERKAVVFRFSWEA
jgi:hypothetical protein